jgi:hypothetical protein
VEALFGGAEAIDGLARSTGAIVRRRAIREGSQLLHLALQYATAGSLRRTAAWGDAALDVALSDVALLGRLRQTQTGDFLEGLVGQLLAQAADAQLGASWEGPPIRLVDASIFAGVGGQTQLRLHASYDPFAQRFERLELTPVAEGEALSHADLRPGMIAVADRNYAKAPQIRQAIERGAFFLLRTSLHSLRLLDPETGERLESRHLLKVLGKKASVQMQALLVDAKRQKSQPPAAPVTIRLIILKATKAQAKRELKRIDRSRSKHGAAPRQDTKDMAKIVLLATNLEPGSWPASRLIPLYRLRWQIELAFKSLKSTFQMRQPPSKDPQLLRSWLLANLAAALLADRLAQALEGVFPPSAELHALSTAKQS